MAGGGKLVEPLRRTIWQNLPQLQLHKLLPQQLVQDWPRVDNAQHSCGTAVATI